MPRLPDKQVTRHKCRTIVLKRGPEKEFSGAARGVSFVRVGAAAMAAMGGTYCANRRS